MTDNILSASVIDRLNAPAAEAICLPNEAYTSEAFFERERELVLDSQWMFAAVGAQIPKRGDVLPISLAGRPLLLTRNREGQVKAFHNVCRHRGLQLVEGQKSGCATLVCPYHAWTYSLDGELKKTPHFGGHDCHTLPGFERSDYGLVGVSCAMWHDLIFVNLSADAPPLAQTLRPLAERWKDYDLSLLRHGGSAVFRAETNWKLAIENFVESYHLPWTHPALNDFSRMEDHYTMVEPGYLGQGSRGYDSAGAGHPDLPLFPGLSETQRTTAEYPYVSPNLMLGMHPSYLFVFGIQPDGAGCTNEYFHFYFVGDEAMSDGLAHQRANALNAWKTINTEDIDMIEGMQRGRASPGYRFGRFSPYHEATTHEFQRRLANHFAPSAAPRTAAAV